MCVPPASPASDHTHRFKADLEALTGTAPQMLGVAVSGGPDSLALLLLAHAAYPGAVHAATVDHKLRDEAAAEAAFVADLCVRLGVPHATLALPEQLRIIGGSKQAKGRDARYQLLGTWLAELGGTWLATAHHLDDQAETLVMRLNRGAGMSGLAGVRSLRRLGMDGRLVRPLLGWRKAELSDIVRSAGIDAVDDPSNRSSDYDRTAARALLGRAPELDPVRLAASASHLADAEEAFRWAEAQEWDARACREGAAVELRTEGLPREFLRRLAARAVGEVRSSAGTGGEWRLDKLAALLERLHHGGRATIAGVQITSRGAGWRFEPAPPRRR